MKESLATFLLVFSFSFTSSILYSQDDTKTKKTELLKAMEEFSATTSINGKGAESYGSFLSNEFSRWTLGDSTMTNKKEIVVSVHGWFQEGWRVIDRKFENIEILVKDNYAFTRRIAHETYEGPSGDNSFSTASLTEIWQKKDGKWLLLRVNVDPH